MSLSQASLAAAFLASTAGTYMALTPPNPTPNPNPASVAKKPQPRDTIHFLNLTNSHINKVAATPLALLSLHSAALAYTYPNIPPSVLHYGAQNGLNASLVTWSPATALPLALLFVAGIPLRLIPYRTLGKNFTFALSKPDGLKTTGIYRYLQHPSYTGLLVLVLCNLALFGRMNGVVGCWVSPQWYQVMKGVEWALLAAGAFMFFAGVWTRVAEEERMLRAEFGEKWERWHAQTARFIPWVF